MIYVFANALTLTVTHDETSGGTTTTVTDQTVTVESGEAYNVTNMDTACSIREMAELVAGLEPEAGVNVRIEIPEDLSSFGYNPQMIIRLDASKLKSIGYVPSVAMEDMFRRTIRSMRERI